MMDGAQKELEKKLKLETDSHTDSNWLVDRL